MFWPPRALQHWPDVTQTARRLPWRALRQSLPQSSIPWPELCRHCRGWTDTYTALRDNPAFIRFRKAPAGDGSLNILYTDYEALNQVILCAQPNCTHDSEACTGWIPYTVNGISLMIAGERLLLVSPGGSGTDADGNACVSYVQSANLDGSERHEVVSFGSDQELLGPYLMDGKYLYAEQLTYTENASDGALIAIDLDTGETTEKMPLDADGGEAVWSASDS